MKTNTTTAPLAQRITQGLVTQRATLGQQSGEECETSRIESHQNIIARVIGFPQLSPRHLADAELITEAFNVTHETGRTPRQLADERAELIAALTGLLDAYAPLRDVSKPDALQSDVRRAVEILTRLAP